MRRPTDSPDFGHHADHHHVTVVAGGRALTPDGVCGADVIIEDGLIIAIDQPGCYRADSVIDAADLFVVPGFIDVQINGGFGYDFTTDPETIWEVGARLPASGVTAFLPTIITSPPATIVRARQVVAAGPPPGYLGAALVGLHLEGPMLSPQRSGTHDARHLQEPRPELIDGWNPEGQVRMVTLAPEIPGALPIVDALCARGVVVSLGHSNASYDHALEAFHRGASFGTHLYNAMSPFHHREPGLVGALLTESSLMVGIIVDGIHVHPGAVQVAWRAKRPDRLVLVTDAMAAMGMGHGTFDLSSVMVTVDETGSHNPDGALAGSTLTLDRAIRNLITFTDCSEVEAIAAATTNPARVLGDPQRGKLGVGARGDVTVLDSDLNVKVTVVGGDIAFADPDVSIKPFLKKGARP